MVEVGGSFEAVFRRIRRFILVEGLRMRRKTGQTTPEIRRAFYALQTPSPPFSQRFAARAARCREMRCLRSKSERGDLDALRTSESKKVIPTSYCRSLRPDIQIISCSGARSDDSDDLAVKPSESSDLAHVNSAVCHLRFHRFDGVDNDCLGNSHLAVGRAIKIHDQCEQ